MRSPLFAIIMGIYKLIFSGVLVACVMGGNASAQHISEDTYCIRLKPPSVNDHFSFARLDTIQELQRTEYKNELYYGGGLLSRFGEEPLDAGKDIFRVVVFGAFKNIKDVQILKIEKRDKEVELSVKVIRKMKDSTVLVHKKIYGPEKWREFELLASRLLENRLPTEQVNHPVHDGGVTTYEGYLSGRYYLLERRAISFTDPGLLEINSFLHRAIGSFFDVNCRKDTRQK